MTPEELQRLERIEATLMELLKSDRYTIARTFQMLDGRNIQLGLTTGTKIGTSALQKIGFFNTTPVVQPSTVATLASGSGDSDDIARQGVNDILTRLKNLGLIAS